MSRFTLIALTGVFLVAGLVAAFVGGAQARSAAPAMLTLEEPQSARDVTRCSLQPHRITHPDNGAHLLVLRSTCG